MEVSNLERRAASRSCLRFVAPMTMLRLPSNPSSCRSNTPRILLVASCISLLHQHRPSNKHVNLLLADERGSSIASIDRFAGQIGK